MAGNICNTTVYEKGNEGAIATARSMFKVNINLTLISFGFRTTNFSFFSDYANLCKWIFHTYVPCL